MDIGDPTFASIVIKFLCVLASIAIGATMIIQSYSNALARRSAFVTALGSGVTKGSLRHLVSLIINILFVWLLCVTVLVLLMVIFGLELREMTGSPIFLCGAIIILISIWLLIIAGKSLQWRIKWR